MDRSDEFSPGLSPGLTDVEHVRSRERSRSDVVPLQPPADASDEQDPEAARRRARIRHDDDDGESRR